MLYLTRKVGETVVVNDDVRITVVEVRGKSIKLGFTFPPSVSVLREELYDRIQEENRNAALASIDMAASFGAPVSSQPSGGAASGPASGRPESPALMRATAPKKISASSTPNLDAMMAGGMFGLDEAQSPDQSDATNPGAAPADLAAKTEATPPQHVNPQISSHQTSHQIEFLIDGEEDIAADNQAAQQAWHSASEPEATKPQTQAPRRRTLTLGDEDG